jgi:hypothetical protein
MHRAPALGCELSGFPVLIRHGYVTGGDRQAPGAALVDRQALVDQAVMPEFYASRDASDHFATYSWLETRENIAPQSYAPV